RSTPIVRPMPTPCRPADSASRSSTAGTLPSASSCASGWRCCSGHTRPRRPTIRIRREAGPPRGVREIEHCWIPLPDGGRLAARVWLPEDATASPVPAILEYIPYRKRDLTRARDEPMHGWFAAHGYAAVRVDVRGSGDSDGVLLDEYHEQELEDGGEVIRWIASQPWCTGAVGSMGKSWGGFNALQIAARRPEALRAIIAVCRSDD